MFYEQPFERDCIGWISLVAQYEYCRKKIHKSGPYVTTKDGYVCEIDS